MNIVLRQEIIITGYDIKFNHITKTVESDVLPYKRDKVADGIWESTCEVIEVIINYQKDEYYVDIEPIKLNFKTVQEFKQYIDKAKKNGWDYKEEEI